MLLKTSNGDKTSYITNNNGKGKRTISSRIHRKTLRAGGSKPGLSGKRVQIGKRISLGKNQKNFNASFPTTSSLCDNSNDSGLGFDHNESQHIIIQQHNNNNSSQMMALTTAANNHSSSISSANYHRSMNTIRYGEKITAQAVYATTSFNRSGHETSAKNKHCIAFGAGKKIKSVIKKPFLPIQNNTNHLTLKNETEDTCGDDFFSTHVQKNNMCNTTVLSPTNLPYSLSSPSEKTSSSSSPILTSPDAANQRSESAESVDEANTLSLTSLQNSNHSSIARDGSIQLQILTQPEQQHRARYQTEGSRGAVKDKSGNGFPVVKLNGYNKPAVLQVFIGNDVGRVSPHIFYQACKVSGKNSTPCNEVKVDGTMVIEIEIKPENDMTVICDCVGILKERNVDVEHRLGKNNSLASTVTRNKKKSTKCRMIFRTKIIDATDYSETLQICSNTITCTQPPGIPEICKKSLDSCSSIGGKELFIIGKNFLKDTKITFVRYDESNRKRVWEETVLPDKEYLQQTHLICTIPAYPDELSEPVQVQFYITSSNKKSEPHTFIYMPLTKYRSIPQSPSIDALSSNIVFNGSCMISCIENESQVTSPENIMPPPSTARKPSFSKSLTDTGTNEPNVNDLTQDNATSPTIQSSTVSYADNSLVNVSGQCYINPISQTSSIIASNHVIDDFQVIHHIKTEQSAEQSSQQPESTQAGNLNSAQQQQVVENFINMICAQVEPAIVQQNNENIINQLNQELILNTTNSSATGSSNNGVIQADHAGNMISAIASQPMICEQNILSVQLDGSNMIPLDSNINSDTTTNTSLISNAVSEAAAETQAVVKQMIASVAAEMLSENPNETQSNINNFISTTLGTEPAQQEIIVQELMTPVMIKKEENDGQPRNVQDALISDNVSNNPSTSSINNQPFSPTPDFNLTSMSESDLISFINPSVFI